ncbi:MAG: hypothetical protein CMI63_17815 [Parvularcula sp.]|nr:hypothetical protein [Parvularcula sp.]
MTRLKLLLSSLLFFPLGVAAEQHAASDASSARAAAVLKKDDDSQAGSVTLVQTQSGVLLTATLTNLAPGVHGFHIHETGACKPDFKAAGGHFAPQGDAHGLLVKAGEHAGDMPNIHVGADGKLKVEILNSEISLLEGEPGYLFDDDGAAIVIHAGADDYRSQPSGDAGDRVACGVINEG